ncbi:pyridoxal phosphate-dependent transferase [Aspergillus similis]
MNPFAAHQIQLGIETLSLRCERIASNALQIAQFLSDHPLVSWVSYPGLSGDKYHVRAMKYLRRGFGGVLAFGVKGGNVGSCAFVDPLKLVSYMTKYDLIRLSVGAEDIEDIIDDLSGAFNAIPPDTLSTIDMGQSMV